MTELLANVASIKKKNKENEEVAENKREEQTERKRGMKKR